MSVVLVSLPGAPKVTEEALKKEEDLDKYLESRVEGKYGLRPTAPIPPITLHVVTVVSRRISLYDNEFA